MARLRRYFLTGLILVLPLFITVYLLFIIFKFIDGIFGGLINGFLKSNFGFSIPGIGIILGILFVLLCGFMVSHFISKRVIRFFERLFLKFPGVKQIYPSAKQIITFLLAGKKTAFKKVVLVEYPSKGLWSVGFLTNDGFNEAKQKTSEDLVHIFIATTPGPWSGFLVLIPRKDIKFLDISVEEAIKLIVSGGILDTEAGDKSI